MTTSTINYTGATVRVPFVGQGIINDSRALDSKTYYAVDIPLNGKNARVWRQSKDIKVLAAIGKVVPAVTSDKPVLTRIDTVTVDDSLTPIETPQKPVIAEIADPTAQQIRDAEPPFVPALRLFRAQVVTHRLEMVA